MTVISLIALLWCMQAGGVNSAAVFYGVEPWPNGIIPYTFDENLLEEAKATHNDCAGSNAWRTDSAASKLCHAMREWHLKTGVSFVPYGGGEAHLKIEFSTYTASTMGNRGALSLLSVRSDLTYGQALHELGHVLGLMHEHQRPDRIAYISMNPALISDIGSLEALGACNPVEELCIRYRYSYMDMVVMGIHSPYDLCSIMHYKKDFYDEGRERAYGGDNAFILTHTGKNLFEECKKNLPDEIECQKIGHNCHLTQSDIIIVRKFNGID